MYNMGPNVRLSFVHGANLTTFQLGPALGPVIGGLLSDHLGWRYGQTHQLTQLLTRVLDLSSGFFASLLWDASLLLYCEPFFVVFDVI